MLKVLIQTAAGSSGRRIYNERTLEFLETRPGSLPYPYPYGFVTGTVAEDGGCVDCYLITKDKVEAGAIVECEPFGLLLQHEGAEIDHKVLAALPGQTVTPGPELQQELQEFIYAAFSGLPDMHIRVGPILPVEEALRHLRECGGG
jgi:inorganic pyrophosphatase